MGREIKRVALDFDWPLNVVWKGYINPYNPTKCHLCGGSGLNPETKKISDDWYTHSRRDGQEGWSRHIGQAEVDALWEKGRLWDFKEKPTPEQVNEWSRHGFGHDSINQWICVKVRAKSLGVYGECPLCNGNGSYFCDDEYQKLYDDWQNIEPPAGEGWQLWEDVSEGSPISPVFATEEDFLGYLLNQGYSEKAALCFIKDGHCFSMAFTPEAGLVSDIETAALNPSCE